MDDVATPRPTGALLALGATAAPWSVPLFMSDQMRLDSGIFVAVATGGAMLNLVIHALTLGWMCARTTGR